MQQAALVAPVVLGGLLALLVARAPVTPLLPAGQAVVAQVAQCQVTLTLHG